MSTRLLLLLVLLFVALAGHTRADLPPCDAQVVVSWTLPAPAEPYYTEAWSFQNAHLLWSSIEDSHYGMAAICPDAPVWTATLRVQQFVWLWGTVAHMYLPVVR